MADVAVSGIRIRPRGEEEFGVLLAFDGESGSLKVVPLGSAQIGASMASAVPPGSFPVPVLAAVPVHYVTTGRGEAFAELTHPVRLRVQMPLLFLREEREGMRRRFRSDMRWMSVESAEFGLPVLTVASFETFRGIRGSSRAAAILLLTVATVAKPVLGTIVCAGAVVRSDSRIRADIGGLAGAVVVESGLPNESEI